MIWELDSFVTFRNIFFWNLEVNVVNSSVNQTESNCIRRWHRSVKRILNILCVETGPGGDICFMHYLPYALLALRTVTHESTGFSPDELVHVMNLRTQDHLFEKWTDE